MIRNLPSLDAKNVFIIFFYTFNSNPYIKEHDDNSFKTKEKRNIRMLISLLPGNFKLKIKRYERVRISIAKNKNV